MYLDSKTCSSDLERYRLKVGSISRQSWLGGAALLVLDWRGRLDEVRGTCGETSPIVASREHFEIRRREITKKFFVKWRSKPVDAARRVLKG